MIDQDLPKLIQSAIDGDRAASVAISLMSSSGEQERLEQAEAMRKVVLLTTSRDIRVPMCDSLRSFVGGCGFKQSHPERYASFMEALEVAEQNSKREKTAKSERDNFTSLLAVTAGVGCWLLTRMITDDDGLRFMGILASMFVAVKVYWSRDGGG